MSRIRLKREPNLSSKHQAFAYQSEAIKAIRDLEYGAIFHEQGLGKTKIAIDIILYWLETKAIDTVLLVVKKSLLANWERELKEHIFIKPRVLTQNKNTNFHVLNSPTRLILTHFEAVKSESSRINMFLKTRSVGILIDESAKLKNPNSSLTKTFFKLSKLFKRRVIMTGTPIATRPYDIWAQILFLDQGVSLGNDFHVFKNALDLKGELNTNSKRRENFETTLSSLFGRISSFCVRETKSSGIINLPQKVYQNITTSWEQSQKKLYLEFRDELRALVIKNGLPKEDEAEPLLKRLLRLTQIASNPLLVDESYSGEPGKFPVLLDLVKKIVVKQEKVIVWTNFTENADWLKVRLQDYGAVKIHGKLDMVARNTAVTDFLHNDDCKVLVATQGSAKEGLTLTVANHVIFYDRGFSLDDYLQSQDRIHRISQKRTCYIYNLLMDSSIDEWVDRLLHTKELAAKLGQGDITYEYYRSEVSYNFSEMLIHVLNLNRTNIHEEEF